VVDSFFDGGEAGEGSRLPRPAFHEEAGARSVSSKVMLPELRTLRWISEADRFSPELERKQFPNDGRAPARVNKDSMIAT